MGKQLRSSFQALRNNFSKGEGWCPPAGVVGVGVGEGVGGLATIEAELAVRVAWTTALKM